jgi:hypothetical protein
MRTVRIERKHGDLVIKHTVIVDDESLKLEIPLEDFLLLLGQGIDFSLILARLREELKTPILSQGALQKKLEVLRASNALDLMLLELLARSADAAVYTMKESSVYNLPKTFAS